MASWVYQQSTGQLTVNGSLMAEGYAGMPPYRNEPSAEWRPNLGPLPQGNYTIGEVQNSPKLGPIVMPLIPSPMNTMFGRDGFWIHGDTADHNASCGCIVMDRDTRQLISESSERNLVVIA